MTIIQKYDTRYHMSLHRFKDETTNPSLENKNTELDTAYTPLISELRR